MEQFWTAISAGCGLMATTLLLLWWKEPERLKQISFGISAALFAMFLVGAAVDVAYDSGVSAQWQKDYVRINSERMEDWSKTLEFLDVIAKSDLSVADRHRFVDMADRKHGVIDRIDVLPIPVINLVWLLLLTTLASLLHIQDPPKGRPGRQDATGRDNASEIRDRDP